MKVLDRYIAKSFIIGYIIAFCVLIGLTILIDLFVNLDEFTEQAQLSTIDVIRNILVFYGLHITLYFRDFSGMILVIAAVFSLGKMVRNNELVAVMASGMSLKRIICPIVFLSLFHVGLFVMDCELLIPHLSDKLVRSHDALPGQEIYDVFFITDNKGSLIWSLKFDVETATMQHPTIIIRREISSGIWEPEGLISADKAVYNEKSSNWELTKGWYSSIGSDKPDEPLETYQIDITPKDIPVRRTAEHKTLLSFSQLRALVRLTEKDKAQLYSQMHFRVTEPVVNVVMLLISLPILVCRDPKSMKSAIVFSFAVTTACLVVNFLCKLMAAEVVFGTVIPRLWAWLPIFIFAPIAFIELDSMKT